MDKLGPLPEVHDIIKTARQQVKQIAKNMPQHQACLDVIEEGIILGGYHGLLKVFFFLDMVLSKLSQTAQLDREIVKTFYFLCTIVVMYG